MARAKYMVDLAEEERVRLRTLLRRGKASVRMVARARVLLRAERRVHRCCHCGCAGRGHCYGGQDSQALC